jgi:hypothetical protein
MATWIMAFGQRRNQHPHRDCAGCNLFLIDSIVFGDFKPAYFAACLLGAAEKQQLSQPPKLALSVFTSSNCHLIVLVETLPAQRYYLPALHFERLAHTHPPISLYF